MPDQTPVPVSRLVEDFQRLRQLGRQRALTADGGTALVVLRCALTQLLARPADDAGRARGDAVASEDAADNACASGQRGARPRTVGADAGRS